MPIFNNDVVYTEESYSDSEETETEFEDEDNEYVLSIPIEFDQQHDLLLKEIKKKYEKVYLNVEEEKEKYNTFKNWKWNIQFTRVLENIKDYDIRNLKPALPLSWNRYIWSYIGYSTWKDPIELKQLS